MIDGRLPWLLVFQVLGVLAAVVIFVATWPLGLLTFTALVIAAAMLHPLAVLLALLVGARTAGLIGALVAVPFLAGLWEIVRELYVEPRREA